MNGWIARRSYSIIHRHGPLAQWLEQATHNRLVAGSSPAGATRHSKGWREIFGPFAFSGICRGYLLQLLECFESLPIRLASARRRGFGKTRADLLQSDTPAEQHDELIRCPQESLCPLPTPTTRPIQGSAFITLPKPPLSQFRGISLSDFLCHSSESGISGVCTGTGLQRKP